MNQKNIKMVFRYCIFLLAMMLPLFVFGVENGYSGRTSTETNDVYSEEDGTTLALSDDRQTQQREAAIEEKKDAAQINSMMGHGTSGHGWMWVGMMIVLIVIMMV
jgi:hypothetical protein